MQIIGRGSKPQYDSRDVIARRVHSQDLVLFPDGEEISLYAAMDNAASQLSSSPLSPFQREVGGLGGLFPLYES